MVVELIEVDLSSVHFENALLLFVNVLLLSELLKL